MAPGTRMDAPLEIDVTTAAHLLGAGALLIDVREPAEVATCAVAGCRHIPMRQIPENGGIDAWAEQIDPGLARY